jgi:tRNA threonylcarbamoyladenosine biosynthesis protein TsaB
LIVLGFDTATAATAVALRLADGGCEEARDDPPSGAHPGHATRLLAMAGELLAGADLTFGQVDRIAVGIGPGTFTGLRVGIATARGLAQGASCELVGVSSLAALAWGVGKHAGDEPHDPLAVIDARRGEVFAAAYRREDPATPVTEPQAIAPTTLAELIAEAGEGDWLAVGDGARRYREVFERLGIAHAPEDSPLHLLRGEAICALGATQAHAGDPRTVLPDYRRRPDAELALQGAAETGRGA